MRNNEFQTWLLQIGCATERQRELDCSVLDHHQHQVASPDTFKLAGDQQPRWHRCQAPGVVESAHGSAAAVPLARHSAGSIGCCRVPTGHPTVCGAWWRPTRPICSAATKGELRLDRPPRRRVGKASKRELSAERVPVLMAVALDIPTACAVLERVTVSAVQAALGPEIAHAAMLFSDRGRAFPGRARPLGVPNEVVNQ